LLKHFFVWSMLGEWRFFFGGTDAALVLCGGRGASFGVFLTVFFCFRLALFFWLSSGGFMLLCGGGVGWWVFCCPLYPPK